MVRDVPSPLGGEGCAITIIRIIRWSTASPETSLDNAVFCCTQENLLNSKDRESSQAVSNLQSNLEVARRESEEASKTSASLKQDIEQVKLRVVSLYCS